MGGLAGQFDKPDLRLLPVALASAEAVGLDGEDAVAADASTCESNQPPLDVIGQG